MAGTVPAAKSRDDRADCPSRRILVLFAHPALERSEANRPLAEAAQRLDGVTLVDLYAEYPDFGIDVDREQTRLREHDVIIFMYPLYWYSTPALLKEWQDLVLEYGFAYGSPPAGQNEPIGRQASIISRFANCSIRWNKPPCCAA